MLHVLRFLSIFASGIAAGTLVTVLLAVIPAMSSLPPAQAVAFKRQLDPLIDRFNPPTVVVAQVAGVVTLFFSMSTASKVLDAVGLAGACGIAIVSLRFNMRINRRMKGWGEGEVPAEYPQVQARWNRFHALRTTSALISFVAYVIALLAA